MKNNILISYSSKSGATKEAAIEIKNILDKEYSCESNVIDANDFNKKTNIAQYNIIIIGSGIRMGRWYGSGNKLLNFFNKNPNEKKKFAIFICSGRIGKASKDNDKETYNLYYNKYIEQKVSQFPNINPIITKKAFGGIKYKKGELLYNLLDKEEIQKWARNIGNLIK
ncbi:MAG: hypothetical protein JXA99_00430 [Candidatus Lokiarchaeota archaeon]|nr:hypothetical protein [Candidatus Lokiarchaeota archaeon]